jgi:hypothetical protein
MGQLIDIAAHRAKFTACELRMLVIDAWMVWSKGYTPATQAWSKAESDKNVAEARKQANQGVLKSYRTK